MKKVSQILETLLFLGVLTLGGIGLYQGPDEKMMLETERRIPKIWEGFGEKTITEKNLKNDICNFEFFLNDRILWKYDFLKGLATMYYHIGESAFPEKVIVGKDDWLFLGNSIKYNNVLEKFLGIANIPKQQIDSRMWYIGELSKICKKQNSQFLFIIVPNKHQVYQEYLPAWEKKSKEALRPESIIEGIAKNEKLELLNLTKGLIEAKNKSTYNMPLYYKHDTHWNRLGSFFAYQIIMQELLKNMKSLKIPDCDQVRFSLAASSHGDLKSFSFSVSQQKHIDSPFVWPKEISPETKVNVNLDGKESQKKVSEGISLLETSVLIVKNPNALNPQKILFIHDSFGTGLGPFLSMTFQEITEVHSARAYSVELCRKLIEKHKPDVVLVERVSRMLP